MFWIMTLGLILRLGALYLFRNIDNFDLQSYKIVGELVNSFKNIYPSPADIRHPYLPFYMYFESLAFYLFKAKIAGIIALKILTTLFDMGIIYLVYLLTNDEKKAFLYAINPVSILIFCLHGQFDAIPILFFLVSIYFFKKEKEMLAMIFYSLSVLTKTWPLLFIVFYFLRLKNKKLIFIVLMFPIISLVIYSLIFKTNVFGIIKVISHYYGLYGIWGLTKFIINKKIMFLVFLLSFSFFSCIASYFEINSGVLILLISFFVFTMGFSIQYFSWLMPFLIIKKVVQRKSLIIMMTLTLLSFYSFWIFYPGSEITPGYLKIIQEIMSFSTWILFIKTLISHLSN